MLPSAGFFEYGTQRYEKIAKPKSRVLLPRVLILMQKGPNSIMLGHSIDRLKIQR